MVFSCDECGEVDHVLVDGHHVGDRLLEGVLFKVSEEEDGFQAEVHGRHANYFEQFNKEMWLERVEEYADGLDIAQCPECNTDVVMPGFQHPDDGVEIP